MNTLESGLKVAGILQLICSLTAEEDAVMMEALRQLQLDVGYFEDEVLGVRLCRDPESAEDTLLRQILGDDARVVGRACHKAGLHELAYRFGVAR